MKRNLIRNSADVLNGTPSKLFMLKWHVKRIYDDAALWVCGVRIICAMYIKHWRKKFSKLP